MTTMKNIFSILAVAVLFLTACAKEDVPALTKAKNWLEIPEPSADADDVDKKIYSIYQEFGVPIFYTDTIGSVDYGMVDEEGNPMLSYQMLHPANQDMTASFASTPPVLTPVQHWIPTEKAKMMFMLEYIESDLLPLARRGGLKIPVILLMQNITANYVPQPLCRGNNVITMNVGMLNPAFSLDAIKKRYVTDLLTKCVGRAWDTKLAAFRKVSEDLLLNVAGADPWSKNNGVNTMWGNIVAQTAGVTWLTLQNNNFLLNNYDLIKSNYQINLDDYEDLGEYDDVEYIGGLMYDLEILKQQEVLWRQRFLRYDPRQYGLTNWNRAFDGYAFNILLRITPPRPGLMPSLPALDSYAVPTKDGDVAAYIKLLIDYSQELLEAPGTQIYNFGDWPVVLERLAMMREILLDMDIDVEVISGRKQA